MASEIKVDTIVNAGGDNDSGIDLSTNDKVAIKTANVERMSVASTGATTITTAGNETTLTLKSTDADASQGPLLDLHRDSSSPADDDGIGRVVFSGENDASEKINLIQFIGLNSDVTDGTEDGRLQLYIHKDGSSINRMDFQPTETVFNDDSADVNFRVESNGNANAIFLDANEDAIGIMRTPAASVKFDVEATGNNHSARLKTDTANYGAIFDNIAGSGTRFFCDFRINNSVKGSITSTGSTTAFNETSDYRLKENVVTDWDATSRLKQLKPSRFNFIADADTTVDGFLAHEVSSVIPQAVTGEKDAVDADGNPEYQGIDQSKLVPLLTKALQEAVAKIETLEARITALESE